MPSFKVGLASSPPNSPRPAPTAEDLDRILSLIRRDSDLLVGNVLGELKDVVDVDELEARAVEGAGLETEFQRVAAKEVFRRRREELEAESMKKKVQVGDAFDSMDAGIVTASETTDVIKATTNAKESDVKANLAYGATVFGGLFLTGAAGIGAYDRSFNELQSIWLAIGPMVGGIFVYYFGGAGKKNGSKTALACSSG